ncbi:Cytochrome P450 87A3 [Linum perenne]
MFTLMIILCASFLITTIAYHLHKRAKPTTAAAAANLPPGSMGWPVIGETFSFFASNDSIDVQPFLLTRTRKHGKIFKTSLAGRKVVVSSDPDFNHYILQQEGKLVELWYLDSFAEIIGQNGTSLKEAWNAKELHRSLKKTVYDHIGVESLRLGLVGRMEVVVGRTLDGWVSGRVGDGGVEVKRGCSQMVMDLSSNIMFGYDPSKFHELNLSDMFASFTRGLLSFPLKIPGTTFHSCLQSQKKILKIITDTINERRHRIEASDHPRNANGDADYDLLDHLIDDADTKGYPDDKGISYLIFGLLFANAETIPSVLTLAISFLTDHPLKENEEIIHSRESTEHGLTWKEYKSMNFTMNYTFFVPIFSINAHSSLDQFRDIRHRNQSKISRKMQDIGSSTNTKNFIPFGGGMRTCVGAEYSKALMAVFLHVLVTKYRWKKVKGGRVYRAPTLQFGDGYFIQLFKKS